jgi:hypothetical protein
MGSGPESSGFPVSSLHIQGLLSMWKDVIFEILTQYTFHQAARTRHPDFLSNASKQIGFLEDSQSSQSGDVSDLRWQNACD